jgi:hypothetical protein
MLNEPPELPPMLPLKRKRGRPRKMDRPTDSIVSAQERSAKIREEAEQIERTQADAAEKQRQHQAQVDAFAHQEQARNVEIVSAGETREHLLQRIRDMRDNPPAPPEPLGYRSEGQIRELNAEQAAGRAAVAKAQAEQDFHRARWQKEEAAQRERDGTMEPVYRENPSQNQKYPANKATLK